MTKHALCRTVKQLKQNEALSTSRSWAMSYLFTSVNSLNYNRHGFSYLIFYIKMSVFIKCLDFQRLIESRSEQIIGNEKFDVALCRV